jgi:uncharacterized membrane protein YqhA
MRTLFGLARYIILIAVIGLLVASIAVLVFGGIMTVTVIVEAFGHADFNAESARLLSTELIKLIDLFLLGTVLLIISIGLYELFIDPHIDLPEWLSVTNLEQLKFNLLAVIVVMLAILFLGVAASDLPESTGILEYGVAIMKPFGGLINTPTFEALAADGLRYNNMHTTALCSPVPLVHVDRAQPPFQPHGRHHRDLDGLPRL